MFTGLSAFPLTPTDESGVDVDAFAGLVERLSAAGVQSIGVLGSTGCYAYLDRAQRAEVARVAVATAGQTPVIVGVGALRTRDVLHLVHDAQDAGASAVLLAPVSYQHLTDDEVVGLYRDVCAELVVPLVVYDNPRTTHVTFSDELYSRVAELPRVASIKIPGVPGRPEEARGRVERLRTVVPDPVTIGVSGDALGATGLNAGCDAWYSAIGGLLPELPLAIVRASADGDGESASRLSGVLDPLWALFARHGSLRVVAAAAEHLGLVRSPCLPRPLRGLDRDGRRQVVQALGALAAADA